MSRNQPGVSPETSPTAGPNQRRTNPPPARSQVEPNQRRRWGHFRVTGPAAEIPTQDLRSDIQVGLDVLDAAISDLHALRPEADVIARISATADFMETVITIALYVRELCKRPADE